MAIWSLNLGLMIWPRANKAGEWLGWKIAHWQLDQMHQMQWLRNMQVNLTLLRAGAGPLMVSAAMEAERENLCELCGRPRRKCFRTQLLDAGRPAPAGACYQGPRMVPRMSEGGYDW